MHQRFGRAGVKLNMFTGGNDCATPGHEKEVVDENGRRDYN